MHFNITGEYAKGRVQTALVRKQLVLERPFRRQLKTLLDHQWKVCAQHARHGVYDVDIVVNSLRGLMLKSLSVQYTRIGTVFFDSVEASFTAGRKGEAPPELKGMATEFWHAFHNWTMRQAARKVTQISAATRTMIWRTIRRETDAGGSYGVVADAIMAKAGIINLMRAARIARTEVHAGSSFAVDESVRSTRVKFVREWVSMLDERTRPEPGIKPPYDKWNHRAANGQRAAMGEPFIVSGEALLYPGDPQGSAGNVINCR